MRKKKTGGKKSIISKIYFICPDCGYDKVEIVLASYVCDKCKTRVSIYEKGSMTLFKKRS